MRRRELVWITVAAVAVVVSITLAATKKDDLYPRYEMFATLVEKIMSDYVDPVDAEKLFQGSFGGMVSSLDPYSQFLPPEAKEQLDIDTTGEYGGLGIEIQLDRAGYLTVVTPMEDTPAFRSGVLAGDRILRIDGERVLTIPLIRRLTEAVKRLRGKPNTDVTITVQHEDGSREDITLTREIISTKSARAAKMVDEETGIGYVRLSQFQEGTAKELDVVVDQLLDQGMRAFILDLRFNPGGLLGEANGVCDRFLSEGVIVSTKGRASGSENVFKATGAHTYPDFPVAVLISRRSASGSEIVAGALQDHRRAVVVGTRSFGKGSVQTIMKLSDGSALRLTTARYYTPSGRSIHRNPYEESEDDEEAEWGIVPDFPVPISREEQNGIIRHWREEHIIRNNNEELESDDEEDTSLEEEDSADDDQSLDEPEDDTVEEEFVDRQLEVAKTVLKAMLLERHKDTLTEIAEEPEPAAKQ